MSELRRPCREAGARRSFGDAVASCLFAAALIGPAGPARAADPPKAAKAVKAASPPASGGAYLTQAQLRDCIARQEVVKADDAELVKEQAAVQAEKDDLARDGEDMKTRLAAVDRTNAESVAAYNDAAEARNRRVAAFQTRTTAFNDRVETNEQAHAAYGKACSNRRYLEDDETAVRKGR